VHTFEPKISSAGYVKDQPLSRIVETSINVLGKISTIGKQVVKLVDGVPGVEFINYFDHAKSVLEHIESLKGTMKHYVRDNNMERDLANISTEIMALRQPFEYMKSQRLQRDSMLKEAGIL
jgi:hypothetical protein